MTIQQLNPADQIAHYLNRVQVPRRVQTIASACGMTPREVERILSGDSRFLAIPKETLIPTFPTVVRWCLVTSGHAQAYKERGTTHTPLPVRDRVSEEVCGTCEGAGQVTIGDSVIKPVCRTCNGSGTRRRVDFIPGNRLPVNAIGRFVSVTYQDDGGVYDFVGQYLGRNVVYGREDFSLRPHGGSIYILPASIVSWEFSGVAIPVVPRKVPQA